MNGYKNAETYYASLWLDTSNATHAEVIRLAMAAEGLTEEDALRQVADALREFVEGRAPDLSGLYADLMDNAIESIDFYTLAQEYMEEIKPCK